MYIWDIAYLWASLLGIIDKKAFCHTHLIELKKTIFSNKRIMHVHDNDKKDYYYNKNDVFNEFFFAEEKIGPAIRKCGIQDYDSLKNNILYVKAHMD